MGYFDGAIQARDESESLEHHGILGQKWGVRRFESASGHLTPAGKSRYYGDSDSYKASNGVKVGAPKNKSVERFRKFQATKAGGAVLKALPKANAAISVGKGKENWKRIAKQVEKETDAVRESEKVHKAAMKGEKYDPKAEQEKKGLSEKQKKAIKIGAAVAATALVTYGGYKLYKHIDTKATDGLVSRYKNESIKLTDTKYDLLNKMSYHQSRAGDYAREINNSGYSQASNAAANVARQWHLDQAGKAWQDRKDVVAKQAALDRIAREKDFSTKEKVGYLRDKVVAKSNAIKKHNYDTEVNTLKELRAKYEASGDTNAAKRMANRLASVKTPKYKDTNIAGRIQDRVKDVKSHNADPMPKLYSDAFNVNRFKAVKAPSSVNNQKSSLQWQAAQHATKNASTKSFDKVFGGSKAPSYNTMTGAKTFIDASKRNDDLVQELLKKNTLRF